MEERPIKVFGLIARKADLPKDDFHDYWRHPHATLTLKIPTMSAYVQSHQIDTDLLPENQRRFEGIAEFWLPDAESVLGWRSNPDVVRHLAPDEPNFLDYARSRYLATRESIRLGPPAFRSEADQAWAASPLHVHIKLLCFLAADKDAQTPTADITDAFYQIGALRQSRCRAVNALQPPDAEFNAVHEALWPSLGAFRAGVAGNMPAWRDIAGSCPKTHFVLARAESILWPVGSAFLDI